MQNTDTTDLLPRIAVPAYPWETKRRNEERSAALFAKRGQDAGYPCIVCGTHCGPAREDQQFLHICGGGGEVADPREAHLSGGTDEHSSGCLAFYPVGPSCLRKFKALRPYVQTMGQVTRG